MIHRQNIRERLVLLDGDIRDLFEMWGTVPNREASKTYNSIWRVLMDVGFRYLVRIYFSNLSTKSAEAGDDVMFDVRINDVVVNSDIDTRERRNANGMPLYKDYMVIIKGRKDQGKHDLVICLNSNAEVKNGRGPFKVFEIMKLSNLENSLGSPNPLPTSQDLPYSAIEDSLQVFGARNMIAGVSITLLALRSFIVYTVWRVRVNDNINVEILPSTKAQRLSRRFSLAEIRRATKHFSDENLIGWGGFGKVYKGLIDDGEKTVAIKQLKQNSKQGKDEFLNEIE